MVGFDEGATIAERMRQHAGASEHLYGQLMRAMADDWESGGPVRDICRGWDEAPAGSVVRHVEEGVLTVVWQSIARQYWPEAETLRVASAIRDASNGIPLAHVAMEFAAGLSQAQLTFELPGRTVEGMPDQSGSPTWGTRVRRSLSCAVEADRAPNVHSAHARSSRASHGCDASRRFTGLMYKTWNTEKSWTVRPSIVVLSAFIAWFVAAALYATVFEY